MKKIFILINLSISFLSFSQVRIGQSVAATLSSDSVLLEFGDTKDKGIILPYVETIPAEDSDKAKGGTLIFDISITNDFPNGEYKVKVKNENSGWTDLSGKTGYSAETEAIVKTPQNSPLEDAPNAKVIIGAESSTSDGVLVLESTDKAMVLPIIEDYQAIKNPSPGMIAFYKSTDGDATKHRLIVFNGLTWSFWKP